MEVVFYILASVWSVGVIAGSIGVVRELYRLGTGWLGWTLIIGVGFPTALFFTLSPWVIIADAKSPTLVELKKSEWECVQSHLETSMVVSGKVMVPTTTHVCDLYGRK